MYIKKSLENKIIYCATLFVVSFFFFGYNNASAATLQINSNSTVISTGDTATLNFVVNTENVAVNGVEAKISFPADKIEVLSISKIGSIFTLWVEDPSFSNSAGIITFGGGIPTPGYTGTRGLIISVVVRAKKVGQAEFVFSNTTVSADDGFGTNILSSQLGKTITINAKEKPEIITPAPTPAVPVLQISSLTHPNQDQWYKNPSPEFQWIIPTGSNSIQTNISNSISDIPSITYSPAISNKTIKDLADGVWYFKVRARKDGIYGPIGIYIVRIDTTAPQKGDVTFIYNDDTRTLGISADIRDLTSGLDYYEVYINDKLVKSIPAKEFINGNYNLQFNASLDNTVKLLAIDRAGNSVESTGSFHATSIVGPKLEPLPSTISADEQLLIRGSTKNPDRDVSIYIKYNNGEPIVYKTRSSNSDRSFFILTPKLKSGDYEIWAETGIGNESASSAVLQIQVTSKILIKIGSFTINSLSFSITTIILLLILSLYFGYHYFTSRHKNKIHTTAFEGEASKDLFLLKLSLENNLKMLQNCIHSRSLTEEENKIKIAIESDLSRINQIIREHEVK